MAFAADRLYVLANELLIGATEGLAEARTGIAPPGRVYVSHGEPVPDCDQLTVHVQQLESRSKLAIGRGAPGQCQINPVVVFVIQLWRCADYDPANPAEGDLNASARQLLIDLYSMEFWLWQLWRTGELLTEGTCTGVAFDTARPLGPQGGMAGWSLPVLYQL